MADYGYTITVSDNIKNSISQKLAGIAETSVKAAAETSNLQKLLNKSEASDKYIAQQQKIARGHLNVASGAIRQMSAEAKLEGQIIKNATAVARYNKAQSEATRSALIGSARIISALSRWASFLGIGFSLKFITGFADEITNLNNKIKTMSVTTANFNRQQREVFEAANRARAPVAELGQTYQRVYSAIKQLGMSQEQAMRITETASKSLSLSGATAEETGAALLQLSQGFNKGKLDGDEFRTVMELMPAAADAIAKQLGVTRGELLKLAPEGKITSKVMADAFTALGVDVDKTFKNMPVTIGAAFTVLRNKALQAFGEFDKASGFTEKLSKAVLTLADNLDTLIPTIISVGGLIVTYFGIKAVASFDAATKAQVLFNLAAEANPYVLIATAIIGMTIALAAFSDKIKVTQDGYITLRDIGITVFKALGEAFVGYKEIFLQETESMRKAFAFAMSELWALAKDITSKLWQAFKWAINNIIFGAKILFVMFTEEWDKLPIIADAALSGMYDLVVSWAEKVANMISETFAGIQETIKGLPGGSSIVGDIEVKKYDFSQYKKNGEGFFYNKEQIDNYATDLSGKIGSLNKDYLGNAMEGLGNAAYSLTETFKYAQASITEETAKRVKKERLAAQQAADPNYSLQGVAGNAGATDETSGKTKKGKILTPQDINRKKFLDTAKSYVNKDTLAIAEKWGIDVSNACAAVVREIGKDAGVALGVSKRPIDAGLTSGMGQGPAFANSFFGQDVGRVFTDIKQVKPGDLVAIEDKYRKWIRHVGIISSIADGELKMIDNSSSLGRVKERSGSSVGTIKAFATPNAFLNEKDIKKKLSDEIKEKEKLAKAFEKSIKTENDALVKIFDFDYVKKADAIQDINKEVAKATLKTEALNYTLHQEAKMFKMSSEEADTYVKWLDYINEYKGQSNVLTQDSFNKLVNENRELEKQRNIREGILQQSKVGENKDFQSALKAGAGLQGEERDTFYSKILEDFGGLQNQLNNNIVAYQTYYDRIKQLRELNKQDADKYTQALINLKIQEANALLSQAEQLFTGLAAVTKTGSKELTIAAKAAAIAQTIFSTYSAAQLAFEQGIKAHGNIAAGVLYAAAAVAQGLARVAQIRSQGVEGYMSGGYTGNGARDKVAGVVHGQEFVFNAAATNRIGVGNLQRLQDGGSLQSYNPPQQNTTVQSAPVVVNTAPPNIAILSSKQAVMEALQGPEGDKFVIEVFERNKTTMTRILS